MLNRPKNIYPSKKPFIPNMKKVKRLRLIDTAHYAIFNQISEKEDYIGEMTQEQNVNNDHQVCANQESTNGSKPGTFNLSHSFINTMSNEELNDHIQKCLEMSSENKITPKNAFALQLIDCMNFILNKKDFSTMACTLDAGAKIYSNRVDALHHQVLKLADEVILNQKDLTSSNVDEGNIHADQIMTKEQRKAKKRIIIASPECLRKHLKGNDPRDKFIKVDGLPGAIISGCKRKGDDLSITLENNIQFWENFDLIYPLNADGTVTLPEYKIYRNEKSEISEYINETNNNEKNIERGLDVQSQESDMNSLISDSGDCDDIDNQSEINGKCEVHVISTAMQKLHEHEGSIETPSSRFEAMKLIFHKSSEYHYLDMKNSYFWAGPQYWKRTKAIKNGNENKVIRKMKQLREIDYTSAKEKTKKLTQKCNILTKRTIASWKRKKFTLPRDLKFDMQLFLDLFNISVTNHENEYVHDSFKSSEMDTSGNINGVTNKNKRSNIMGSQNSLVSSIYDVFEDDEDDAECPGARDTLNSIFNGEIRQSQASRDFEIKKIDPAKVIKVEIGLTSAPTFGESSLVPVPKIVRFQPIKYSSRPIRIDMQHLKKSMLDIIKKEVGEDAERKMIWADCSSPEVTLGNILKKLPGQLEKRTAEDLTPSTALMALLTLANENNLNLVNDDAGDVVVRLQDYAMTA